MPRTHFSEEFVIQYLCVTDHLVNESELSRLEEGLAQADEEL